MWESVLGKLNAMVGHIGGFGIPFTPVETLIGGCDRLHDAGFPRMGRQQLYSGVTGVRIPHGARVRWGMRQRPTGRPGVHRRRVLPAPALWWLLLLPQSPVVATWWSTGARPRPGPHPARDKVHARSLGPVSRAPQRPDAKPTRAPWGCSTAHNAPSGRQPTEGRARQGGLRIGEMERPDVGGPRRRRDARLSAVSRGQRAHSGTSALPVADRNGPPRGHKSDAFRIVICGSCGRTTCHDAKQCLSCKKRGGGGGEVVGAVVPFAPGVPPDDPGGQFQAPAAGDRRDGHRRAGGGWADGPSRLTTDRCGIRCVWSSPSRKRAVRTASLADTAFQGMRMSVTPLDSHRFSFRRSSN